MLERAVKLTEKNYLPKILSVVANSMMEKASPQPIPKPYEIESTVAGVAATMVLGC